MPLVFHRRRYSIRSLRSAAALAILAGCAGAGLGIAHLGSGDLRSAPVVRLPPVSCTRYAATTGTDAGKGTPRRPFRSVQALVDSLRPGQTGCLLAGTYTEDVSIRRGGTRGRPVTLAGAPGGLAVVRGTFWVANGADYVTVRNLALDGASASGAPSPQVNGDHATFYRVDVTNGHTGICFMIGGAAETYGVPRATTIARSRIHDCGRLPPGHLDHGIYLAHSIGATIVDNLVYDNADWGLHLFPDAQGSNIQYNVFDGNGDGAILAGTADMASSGNTIARNIFSNSVDGADAGKPGNNYGYNLTSFWGERVGTGNVVEDNCFWNGAGGNVNSAGGGFVLSGNRVANPRYVARAAKNFRLLRTSPCTGDGPRSG
jgi:parallel beta-helix repeat protein